MFTCKDCRYFITHSSKTAKRTRVYGHCTVPRVKIRRPDSQICPYFTSKNKHSSQPQAK